MARRIRQTFMMCFVRSKALAVAGRPTPSIYRGNPRNVLRRSQMYTLSIGLLSPPSLAPIFQSIALDGDNGHFQFPLPLWGKPATRSYAAAKKKRMTITPTPDTAMSPYICKCSRMSSRNWHCVRTIGLKYIRFLDPLSSSLSFVLTFKLFMA